MIHVGIQKSSWVSAWWDAFTTTGKAIVATAHGLGIFFWSLISGSFKFESVAGPVGIFQLTGQVFSLGTVYLLQFIAILSVNLALLNFLPIPGLDGGRVFIMILEKIRRRAFNPELVARMHGAGIIGLIILILIITYYDVARLL